MPSNKSNDTINDLVEFYNQWSELRDVAIQLQNDPRLESRQALVLEWMVFVVDRVGPADLGIEKGSSHD